MQRLLLERTGASRFVESLYRTLGARTTEIEILKRNIDEFKRSLAGDAFDETWSTVCLSTFDVLSYPSALTDVYTRELEVFWILCAIKGLSANKQG